MTSSSLGNALKRTSDALLLGASAQVADYEERFHSLKNLYDNLLSDLIKTNWKYEDACSTAKEFFGTQHVRFAGIDGTMYARPLFDLMIFFGGAYASTGTITFAEEKPTIAYDEKTIEKNAGLSSVVPVYINEIPEIDQQFFAGKQPEEVNPNMPLTDDSIIDNAAIANWIMTFAEYYLAYKLATDPEQDIRIIFLDRSLSIERASLISDTAKRYQWETKSAIIGYETNGQTFDINDLTIARQCVCNKTLKIPPPRGDYLSYAIINLVRQKGKLNENEILAELGITEDRRIKRARKFIKRSTEEKVFLEKDGNYTLNPKYTTTSDRIKALIISLGDRFFSTKLSQIQTNSVMKILKNDKQHWLTTLDIAFLTLFTLQMLMEECWQKHILLIGITKDTAARDFKRQLIPIMQNEQLLKKAITRENFEKLPNTDRMILQSTSIFNSTKIIPPWSLIEYDSAFRTMVPDKQNRKGYVSGAIKNRTSLEKTFLKTYVQLSQAKTDPMLRSNVLLTDRLVYPEYDLNPENTIKLSNEFGAAEEPVEVLLFKNKDVPNKLQNLTMTILTAMAPTSIPEAFGHNKSLFIADKIAKWNFGQFKRIVDTTADWVLNNHKLRKFIFYMSTFRERRATIEKARREQT